MQLQTVQAGSIMRKCKPRFGEQSLQARLQQYWLKRLAKLIICSYPC